MSNEEMIKEELENLGCKALDDTHYLDGILPFIDDTYRIFIKVFLFENDTIGFHVYLTTEDVYKTILVSNQVPFNSRGKVLSEIKNILEKHHQLVKKYEQYQNTLSFIQENNESETIQEEFISHFSQFGVKALCGIIVYRYFGKMIISLGDNLHLEVFISSDNSPKVCVFSALLNKGNYKLVFDNVDDLIHEFKEKSPDADTYLELLKESI
jgi:hypothetical protein